TYGSALVVVGNRYRIPPPPNVIGSFVVVVPPIPAAICCAAVPRASGAALATLPNSPNTWRRPEIVTPTSAPYDWLVTLPNADCATPSTYPMLAEGAAAFVCAYPVPPTVSIPTTTTANSRIR